MLNISSLLSTDNILLGVSATSKKRLFEQASQSFSLLYGFDRDVVFESFFNREKLGSTYLGHCFAVPHGRVDGSENPKMVFIRLNEPLGFGPNDEMPASNFFFLTVPQQAHEEHLEILAQIAGIVSDNNTRKLLVDATTVDEFREIILAWYQKRSDLQNKLPNQIVDSLPTE